MQLLAAVQGSQGGQAGAHLDGRPPGVGATRTNESQKIVAKFVRSEMFRGGQSEWEDWSFAFKRAVRSQSIDVYKKMVEVERSCCIRILIN